jgi:hypothetical protein
VLVDRFSRACAFDPIRRESGQAAVLNPAQLPISWITGQDGFSTHMDGLRVNQEL